MATASRPIGISGIAWPPLRDGWSSSQTIADPPATATNLRSQIVPELFSSPGKDILTGVDALVKDGIADPNQLTIGGYSYGGYMTNWVITQTTRFKAAVTGAGGVENVADWGNDDSSVDDANVSWGPALGTAGSLSQRSRDFPDRQSSNAYPHGRGRRRIFAFAVLEGYLLDRALHELNVPSDLLIFPGEGHSLDKNPWHGKIKVREELKWLEKYGGATGAN